MLEQLASRAQSKGVKTRTSFSSILSFNCVYAWVNYTRMEEEKKMNASLNEKDHLE